MLCTSINSYYILDIRGQHNSFKMFSLELLCYEEASITGMTLPPPLEGMSLKEARDSSTRFDRNSFTLLCDTDD